LPEVMIPVRSLITRFCATSPRPVLTVLALLAISLTMPACTSMGGRHLRIEPAKPSEVMGTYTLLLYGCRYPDDLENVAILDKDGDPYTIEIYAPDFRYTVKTGLSAEDALKQAERFVQCSVHYQQTRFSRIADPAGGIAGYEARGLYSPIRFGMYDVLDVQYVARDNKIVVYIKLDPAVEKELSNEGGPRERESR
jgi:hypothetical protein